MIKIPSQIIIQYIEDNFDYKYTSDGCEFRINSPFTIDKKYHCYINKTTGNFTDYKSGLRGNFLTFLKEYNSLNDIKEAERLLISKYFKIDNLLNSPEEPKTQKELIQKTIDFPENMKFFNEDISFLGKKALNYLKKRGFSLDKINQNKIGYCYDGEFSERIIIPFFEKEKMVYYIARSFTDSPLRYKNIQGIDSKDYVFNYDKIADTVVIVEGVFDALTLNYPVATSILSAEISEKQVKKILEKNVKNIIFVADNDETGKRTLYKNWQMFVSNMGLIRKINYYVFEIPKQYKDLNESGINYISLDDCKKLNKTYFLRQKYDI